MKTKLIGLNLLLVCVFCIQFSDAQLGSTLTHTTGSSDALYVQQHQDNSASMASGHPQIPTWTDPHGRTGVKYKDFQVVPEENSCMLFTTGQISHSTYSTDTKIWVKEFPSGNWMLLDDDDGPGYLSSGTVYTEKDANLLVRFSGYSSSINDKDFNFYMHQYNYQGSTCSNPDITIWH